MTDPEAQALLTRIMDAYLGELAAIEGPLSCIGASAALINVLHGLGYNGAYPLTVEVEILNPIATRSAERASWVPGPGEAEEGADSVWIGAEGADVGPNNWAGHLVVILPIFLGDRHILLDPTIMQANKPGTGINLPAIIAPVRDDFTSGVGFCMLAINGCALRYKARPDDHSYKQGGNWDRVREGSPVSDRVLAFLASLPLDAEKGTAQIVRPNEAASSIKKGGRSRGRRKSNPATTGGKARPAPVKSPPKKGNLS